MGITITYISSDTIKEKCAPRLPVWANTLAVIDTMKLHCIKLRNPWRLEVAVFSRDENLKFENILRTNITGGNDAEPDLSLSDAEGDIGDDVLDPDQVIHDNIIININDRVLVSYKDKRFPGEVTNITGSEFEVNVIHKSGNL